MSGRPPDEALILVATDFSAASERARDYAIALADPSTRLMLLHAHPLPLPDLPERADTPDWMGAGPSAREAALERLQRFGAPARAAGLSVTAVLQEGLPAEVIQAQTSKLQPDLIAMGTHGRGIVERWVLGSTAERVVRLAAVPVLTVTTQAVGPAPRICKVLCALGADGGDETLAYASVLADRSGRALIVMHVLESVAGHAPGRWRERNARERLREAVALAGRTGSAEILLRAGRPSREIVRVASERAADVIVVGAHDRRSGARRCFSGTANEVVREAGCAVIRLPAAAERESREALEARSAAEAGDPAALFRAAGRSTGSTRGIRRAPRSGS
jgi:nucleotide-binding universal stress UspA family protein